MKPRNKLEHKLQAIVNERKLTPLSASQRAWIINDIEKKQANHSAYYQTTQKCQGLTLRKLYLCQKEDRKKYNLRLIMVSTSDNGVLAISSRAKAMSYYVDAFTKGNMTIKDTRNDTYRYNIYLHMHDCGFVVGRRDAKEVKYNTLLQDPCDDVGYDYYEYTDPHMETLSRLPEYRGLMQFLIRSGMPNYLWKPIRIAIRNHYIPERNGWYMWRELMNIYHKEKKDLCNAHYVCPADLETAYAQARHREDVRNEERRLAQMRYRDSILFPKTYVSDEKTEKNFIAKHKKWFGIAFVCADLNFRVLSSVEEYWAEANEMRHCVFRNKYYDKANSIILSCTDNVGNRLETIEVDTQELLVLQSQGKHNSMSNRHSEIVSAMRDNMWRFKTKKAKKSVELIAV